MIEGAPVMHEGELIGFVKKEYKTARLAEVILVDEPRIQVDLKTLEDALKRVPKPHRTPPPEATELLDADSILVSRAISNSVVLPLLKPVMKTLIPLEAFKPISGTQYILQVNIPVEDLMLGIGDRLVGIPGLAGEWFMGKVDGIIMRSRRRMAVELPIKTGMMSQPSPELGECFTIFDFNTGFKTFKTVAEANIPIMYGDVMLVDGALEEKKLLFRAKLVFLIRSREMWILD